MNFYTELGADIVHEIHKYLMDGTLDTKDIALVKKTCETFTRLLLSLTPYKAKEFVEKNCAKVSDKIVSAAMKQVLSTELEDKDDI